MKRIINKLDLKTLANLSVLWKFIIQYAGKMKLWSYPSLYVLLSKDQETRKRSSLIELLYSWPGTGYKDMYKKHRDMKMPFHFMPSCSRFIAILSPYDWILALFGRAIRGKGSRYEVRNWRNGKANRYLFSEFLYLGMLRDEKKMTEYWKKGWHLMSSHAYQVACFNYVHHGWQQSRSVKEVNKIMKEVKELVQNRATEIDFKRVYIPKGETGKWRPLGVPTLSWRVYLHMLNNLLVWVRIGREGTQHGYFPGRGVHTAWKEVLDHTSKKNIYEFDLTGFFDNVDLMSIGRELQVEYKFDWDDKNFIMALSQSVVKLTPEDKIPEPDRILRYKQSGEITDNYKDKPGKSWEELHPEIPQELMIEMMKEDMEDLDGVSIEWIKNNYETVYKKYQEYQWAYLGSFYEARMERIRNGEDLNEPEPNPYPFDNPEQNYPKNKGVPQGASTSCSTSTLAISNITEPKRLHQSLRDEAKKQRDSGTTNNFTKEEWTEDSYRIIMYADDGVIISEEPLLIAEILKLFEPSGVKVNQEKSGWVKEDGKWTKELKFLGITYNGMTKKISAKTRSGATLEFDMLNQFLAYLLESRESILNKEAVKFEGSASHLNGLESYEGTSVKSWVLSEALKFFSVKDPEQLLFKGEWSGYFLSSLYCNSWVNNRPADVELQISNRNSWIKTQWPKYRLECLNDASQRKTLLWGEMKRILDRISELDDREFVWAQLFGGMERVSPKVLSQRLKDIAQQMKQSSKLLEEYKRMAQAIWLFEGNLSENWWKTNEMKISSGSEITGTMNQEMSQPQLSKRLVENCYEALGSCLQLNIYNSSSFACDSLLQNYPIEDKALIKYYEVGSEPVVSREERERRWEAALPEQTKKLRLKIIKNFRKNFLVLPKWFPEWPEILKWDDERTEEVKETPNQRKKEYEISKKGHTRSYSTKRTVEEVFIKSESPRMGYWIPLADLKIRIREQWKDKGRKTRIEEPEHLPESENKTSKSENESPEIEYKISKSEKISPKIEYKISKSEERIPEIEYKISEPKTLKPKMKIPGKVKSWILIQMKGLMETVVTFILWFIGTLALLTLVEMLMRIGVKLEPEIPFVNDDIESETKGRPNPISRLFMWIMIFIVCMLLAGVVMKYGETNRPPDGSTAPPPERPESPMPEVTRTPPSETIVPQESEPMTTAAGTRIDEVIPGLSEFFKRPLPKIPEEEEVTRSPEVRDEPGVSSERSTLEYFKPSTSQPDPRLAEVHDSHIYAGQVKFEYEDGSDVFLEMNTHSLVEGSRAMVAATHWEDPYPTFLMEIASEEMYTTFLQELSKIYGG